MLQQVRPEAPLGKRMGSGQDPILHIEASELAAKFRSKSDLYSYFS